MYITFGGIPPNIRIIYVNYGIIPIFILDMSHNKYTYSIHLYL